MRRTALRHGSTGAVADLEERRKEHERIRVQVAARDGFRCILAGGGLLGPCSGPLTPHHLWKSKHGGPYVAYNLVTLCAGHNSAVENHPEQAHSLGLVVRAGQTLVDAWARMVAIGLVPGFPEELPET